MKSNREPFSVRALTGNISLFFKEPEMTKQPDDWLDDVPGDDVEDEDDEIIWVSKSEIKRDAEELKRLGAEMVELGKRAG